MNKKQFMKNTTLLTSASLLMRSVGCIFQVWLAARIGSAGIGLFDLLMAVGGLAITFSVSGIGFGTMRLVSEELGRGNTAGIPSAVRRCMVYALICGSVTGALLYRHAESIAFLWIEDGRTVIPLQIMAFELPCIALSFVFTGYFTACGRIGKSTLIQLVQQILTVFLTVSFLLTVPQEDIAQNCACITLAGTLSDGVGCLLLFIAYRKDSRKQPQSGIVSRTFTKRLLAICAPLAISAYTRSGLSTIQHMLVPAGLRTSGLSATEALSTYGIVHGMSLSVIFLPTCVLSVVAQLLLPKLTELQVREEHRHIHRICTKILTLTMGYAVLCAVILFLSADVLANKMYQTPQVSTYIRIFCPLIPITYMDIIVDGCLKGLGQQMWSMGINVLESAISVVLTAVLVPQYGVLGFILVIYADELFNFALSFHRLTQVISSLFGHRRCKTELGYV